MNTLGRGVKAYLLALAFVGTLAALWGTNRFLLGNTTAGTGWPLMVAVAGVLVPLGAFVRRRRAADDAGGRSPWSRDRR